MHYDWRLSYRTAGALLYASHLVSTETYPVEKKRTQFVRGRSPQKYDYDSTALICLVWSGIVADTALCASTDRYEYEYKYE